MIRNVYVLKHSTNKYLRKQKIASLGLLYLTNLTLTNFGKQDYIAKLLLGILQLESAQNSSEKLTFLIP